MLIGVYDGLYAAAAELGIADPLRASQFRMDMAEAGADGRYYCLPAGFDRRLESYWLRNAS
jgi:hypothetical protein